MGACLSQPPAAASATSSVDAQSTVGPRTPNEIARFYGIPTTSDGGAGQHIAVIALDAEPPLDLAELKRDFEFLGMTEMPMVSLVDVGDNVSSDGGSDAQGTRSGETHLDVEVIGALCPAAQITVYRGHNDDAGFAAAVARAVEDGAKAISISWGHNEHDGNHNGAMERALLQARDAGATVCVAAGDGGSGNNRLKPPDYAVRTDTAYPSRDGFAHVCYPASSPLVLACGGTELGDGGKEVVWNRSSRGGGATGGGVSNVFLRPSHQPEVHSANRGERAGRVVPDVAALAAFTEWQVGERRGVSSVTGGTSAVAPLWASLIALVNQRRAGMGKRPVGFVNEALYNADRAALFHDIVHGSNGPVSDEGFPSYRALNGFDACTGLGSPKAAAVLNVLVGLP